MHPPQLETSVPRSAQYPPAPRGQNELPEVQAAPGFFVQIAGELSPSG